ncbi:MAG: endonuclease domain-containing protein [Solirubrobacteraceae bacterium]
MALAETLPAQALARAVHEAEVLRLFDGREFDRFNGRRGATRLQALLQDPNLANVSPEEFDERFLKLCAKHHLPPPQMHVHLPAGPRLLEVDALWPDQRLCVELDGAHVHHTRRAFSRDRERDLALAAEGYVTVRLTWGHVTREAARVATHLHRLLACR